MIDMSALSDKAYYSLKEVAQLFDVSDSAIRKRIKKGDFPAGFKMPGTNQHFWLGKDIRKKIESAQKAQVMPKSYSEANLLR